MANVSEIREHLRGLLSEQQSLDEFEDWFVPYSWNIHKFGDEASQQFAYSIDHVLSRFDGDSAELRQQMREVLDSFSYGRNKYGVGIPLAVAESNADSDLIVVAA